MEARKLTLATKQDKAPTFPLLGTTLQAAIRRGSQTTRRPSRTARDAESRQRCPTTARRDQPTASRGQPTDAEQRPINPDDRNGRWHAGDDADAADGDIEDAGTTTVPTCRRRYDLVLACGSHEFYGNRNGLTLKFYRTGNKSHVVTLDS